MSTHEFKRHPGLNLNHDEYTKGRKETAIFGFWVFLMSDLILFGLMFAVYITMIGATAGGPGPKELFDFMSLGTQTALLLLSSLTIGVAMLCVKHEHYQKWMVPWLCVTLVLGLSFLTLEVLDFMSMMDKGGVPSRSGYLSAFYVTVSLHGAHVAAGCLWLVTLLVQIRVFGVVNIVRSRLMRLALFWHFLDIIWIGMFSIVFFGGWIYA